MSRINMLLTLCLCLALPALSQSIKPGPYDPGAARQSELNAKMNADGSNADAAVDFPGDVTAQSFTLGVSTITEWPGAVDLTDYYTKAEVNANFVATSTFSAGMDTAFGIVQANYVATSTFDAAIGDIDAALTAILGD